MSQPNEQARQALREAFLYVIAGDGPPTFLNALAGGTLSRCGPQVAALVPEARSLYNRLGQALMEALAEAFPEKSDWPPFPALPEEEVSPNANS